MSPTCFGCSFSTIIREPQSSAKVTYVRCIYGDNGVVTACRFTKLMPYSTLEDLDRQGEDRS